MRFAASMDASGIRKGAAEAVASLKSVTGEAGKTVSALEATGGAFRKAAKDAGHYYDAIGRLHRADGKFASASENAAIKAGTLTASVRKATDQTRALGSSSEKAGKQMQGFGSGSDSASKSLAHASSVADALNKRLASLTSRVLATYSAYKLLQGVVTATNVGIQANATWESQKLSIASIVSSTNQLADAQGRVLEGAEKFAASQQVAEKLMQRIQQLGLETTATTQELVTGFQAIIAPALKAGYALEEIPELATRAAQAMGAFQIPIQQMRTEVEALLSGNINRAQDLLAPYLNISKELVKEWKAQGVLVEEINKRLESFKYAGDAIANTWDGLVSNTREYVEFISRGATEGLFNSLKSSAREFQSLLISINEQTGRPEVSNKVNNLVAAYERLNDVIGDKIISATEKFSEWIEEINQPENLSQLETTVSNIGHTIDNVSGIAANFSSVIGTVISDVIDGWNNLPDAIRDFGLIGAVIYGKKGFIALGIISELSNSMDKLNKKFDFIRLPSLQNLKEDFQDLVYITKNFTDIFSGNIDLRTKEWVGPLEDNLNEVKQKVIDSSNGITSNLRQQLETQRQLISSHLDSLNKEYDGFMRLSESDLIDGSTQYYASQKAEEASEQIRIMKAELDSVTSTLKNIYTEAGSIDWYELMNHDPINDTAVAFAGLLTTSSLFGKSVMTAKDNVDALDGSSAVASIDFRINTNAGSLFSDAGQGTMFALPQWSETWKTVLQKIRSDIKATGNTAGKTADKAKSKIESALHSVESELNRLQMTDAQYKQWQVNEKVEKLEKLLGASHPRVIELRAALEKELHDNLLKDILSYADPAAAALAKVDKEYQDFLSDIEIVKKSDPARYTQLMAKAETEHEKALRKATRAGKEQTDHTQEKLAFYKELEELTGQYGLSLKYQNDLLNEQVELWRDADIPEDYINKMRELRELQMSRDWVDGAKRGLLEYRASASDTAKGVEESFKGLFDGMDSGWKSSWQQMIETGKMSLSSFRSLFASFLADLLHMAITRPITVQIAGVVSGMLGAGGVAHAAGGAGGSGGAGGLLGNIPFSSLLPDSITGGVSSFLSYELPGTAPGISGLYGPTMSGGNLASGLSLGSALMYGGFGSLGYSLLGGALGLPQGKYSGLTAGVGGALGAWGGSALGSAAGIAAGSTLGSVVPVIGTALGAVAGGLIGSMFGKTRTHPSVYTNVPEASLVGTDWAEAFKQGAWGHRMSAGEIAPFFDEIGGYANSTAQRLLSFAQSLPEAYAAGVTENLKKQTVGMGRGTTAGRGWVENRGPSAWDLQFYDDEHTERAYRTTQQDIARVMLQGLAKSMDAAGTSIRDIFPHLNLRASNADLSESDEWTKAVSGLTAIQGIQDAIKNIDGAQMTQAEQQAKAFVEQLEALSSAVASYGVDKGYADRLVEEYRAAYVDSYVKSLDEMFHPLSQVEQQARGYKEAIDGYVKALETMQASEAQLAKVRGYTQTAIDNIISSLESSLSPMAEIERARQNANTVIDQHLAALRQLGASEGEIARVEALRAEAVKQATEELLRSFEQNVAQRWAALDGTSDEVGRAIAQENELREAVLKFGEGSAQVAELLKLHAAETAKAAEEAAKAAQEAAKSEYDALKSQMDALEQQRVQLRQQAIQEESSALNEQMNAAKTLKSTWEGLDKSLGQSRYNLFAGSANLDAENRLGTVQAEFRRLSGLAMGGDSEAAGQLAGVGSSLLDLVKQTAGTEEDYLDAFWAVNAQLKNAQDVAGAQVSSADKQLEALQGQLDVQNAALAQLQGQSTTLEEIEKQIAALRPVLEAAADKAGIKAFARGGLALPGWALVGEKGPELVNFSQPGRVYTAADTAALFRSATPRAADAGSREEVKALREEVYQLRRDTLISMSEIARFSRRIADMIEAWDAEGMPGVRA